jgi:hypothetical protein
MKNKLRKIHVENSNVVWLADWNDCIPEYLNLRIWIDGKKNKPWITIHYRFHDKYTIYPELLIAQSNKEYNEKAMKYFQLKPMTPKIVSDIIIFIMDFFYEKYNNKLYNNNLHFFYDRGSIFEQVKDSHGCGILGPLIGIISEL